MLYLNKTASERDTDRVARGLKALKRMDEVLNATRFLVGDTFSLADISLLAYTHVAHEGGFDLAPFPSVRRWIGDSEKMLGL